ncbi:glycoside hydrolase family 5 protein [Amanita thiersii Skay4041]|uniref:Glycoside hydrolase family 5 protein n=1 Tax=Amanita thiersii Skay4041 TaxID=703135 RepID=A0A2A9NKX8_9AGAR|nr:glycoside hydrolase family 5 protein [Amanita thiersii Skay4041]
MSHMTWRSLAYIGAGNGFTGGHSWTQTTGSGDAPSSDFMNQLVDLLGNTVIDVHEVYIEFSGSPSNLASLTTWLRDNNLRTVLSEFGGTNNANCFTFIGGLLTYLAANDEYIWAAGRNTPCCSPDTGSLEPGQFKDLGQPDAVRPNIPVQDLKRSGISNVR